MFARKCDRCGKLYENYYHMGGNAMYVFNRDDNGQALENQVYVKDLCPDCMAKLRNFMDGWEPVEEPDCIPDDEAREGRFIEAVGADEDMALIARATGDDFPFIAEDFERRGYTTQEDGKTWTKEQMAEQIRKNMEGKRS